MAIPGYITVPATATVGGAPIDAFQGDAFRTNGDLFERYINWLSHASWCRNDGADLIQTHTTGAPLDPKKIWRTTSLTVTNNWLAAVGFPLIALATGTITINAVINAQGCSTPGSVGNLGGSGGGGNGAAGLNSVLPISGGQLAAGGAAGANGNAPADANHILRCLSMAPMLNGGGAGGNSGSNGGGVVILVANTIVFGASGSINVSGNNGAANTGGGGGGCVILIAKTFTGTVTTNVLGGTAGPSNSGAGGAGIVAQLTMP